MNLNGDQGYFLNYYSNLIETVKIDENFLDQLKLCQNDFERMLLVDQLANLGKVEEQLPIYHSYNTKDPENAAAYKEKGNLAFKNKDWSQALMLYSKSYLLLPHDKDIERAVILGNRSAALYHMEKYSECLMDIKRSIDAGYPTNALHKLLDRQARCYLALKDYVKALDSFKKFITSLDDAVGNLDVSRQSQFRLNAMTIMKLLEKDIRSSKQTSTVRNDKKKHNTTISSTTTANQARDMLNKSVAFDENLEMGRYAKALNNLTIGERILVEQPFVAVLFEKFSKTHCQHCFIRVTIPMVCQFCSNVIFCSDNCLQLARESYHKYECGILTALWNSGCSINCLMAYRIFASRQLNEFLQIDEKHLSIKPTVAELRGFKRTDYRRIIYLVRHTELRSGSSLFQLCVMARFLTKCLQTMGYFGSNPQAEHIIHISALMTRTLQLLQFNSHEVSELHITENNGTAGAMEKTLSIGGALYPTLALFNHSCDPNLVRYFRGTTVYVNAIKSITSGSQIYENYGPIYTQMNAVERKIEMKEKYNFDCSCIACMEDWPTLDRMPNDVIRFRCNVDKDCNAAILIPNTYNDFTIKCTSCGQTVNIFLGIKVVQDTVQMMRLANECYQSGDYEKARKKYIDLLRIMSEVLVPPFDDFCQCQQYLKDCFLHCGNNYLK